MGPRFRLWAFASISTFFTFGGAACSGDSDPDGPTGGSGGQATTGATTSNGPTSGVTTTTSGTTSTSSTTGASSGSGTGGSGGTGPCAPMPSCDAALPDVGAARDWNNTASEITAAIGFPNHRGRDMFYNPGDDVWVMAKFAYGLNDGDIHGEEVDVWLDQDCGSSWQKLDTVLTSDDGENPTIEGVEDTGGRIYYKVPSNISLAPGRHRFLLVVGGDLSTTEVLIDIVPPGTPIVVSDVDGTLTTSENAEFGSLLTGSLPDANADAPEALSALAAKGYRVLYLTARPEWLGGRTREFVADRGFPEGLYHTTLSFLGATGQAAADFKSAELAAIAARGLVPTYAFGNTSTDADAYDNAGITPLDHRIFYQFDDTVHGGRRIDAYSDLSSELSGLPQVCP